MKDTSLSPVCTANLFLSFSPGETALHFASLRIIFRKRTLLRQKKSRKGIETGQYGLN